MAREVAKEALQAAATDPVRLLLPLIAPATGAGPVAQGQRQVPSTAPDALAPPLHLLPGGQLLGSRSTFRGLDGTSWISRSHTFPAAWPRAVPTATTPTGVPFPLPGLSKSDAAKAWESLRPVVADASLHRAALTTTEQEKVVDERIKARERQLWSVVQRIVPESRSTTEKEGQHVTLVLAHANGLHKETWEPFLQSLLEKLPSDIVVDDIWSLDTLVSGEASSLNRLGVAGGFMWWPDVARDVLQLIKHYLPAAKPDTTIGDVLPRAQVDAQPARIVLIGHSFGAGLASLVANTHPELVHTLIMIDPPLAHPPVFSVEGLAPLLDANGSEIPRGLPIQDHSFTSSGQVSAAEISARRRDVWPSRQAAKDALGSSPFYACWHPSALESFLDHALVPVTPEHGGLIPARTQERNTPVTLSTSKFAEAACFGGTWSGTYVILSILSGAFSRYWVQREGATTKKGRTFTAYATQYKSYALLGPYYERMRVIQRGHESVPVLAQRSEGEELRSQLTSTKHPELTDGVLGWDDLRRRFPIQGETAIFMGSEHMLPQIQPQNVANVVSGWLKETISLKGDSHL